jgi:Ca-activated chloride channel family protein
MVVALLVSLLTGGLGTPPAAHALNWDSLWKHDDQQQQEAIEAYHNGDFQAALQGFSLDKTATGAFNRGNALARSEQLEEALDAYDTALSLQPDFEDAKYNRKLVEDALNQQQQQGENDQTPDSEQEADDSGKDDNNQEPSQSDQSDTGSESEQQANDDNEENPQAAEANEDNQSSDQSEKKPASESSQEAQPPASPDEKQQDKASVATATEGPMDEDDQALELLLRQVPDDPGALLRRKFKYQYQNQQP